jgi:hypothetical protein
VHGRQVTMELSRDLMVLLIEECTINTCPQMKASDDWVFLCAAHRLPIEVSAPLSPLPRVSRSLAWCKHALVCTLWAAGEMLAVRRRHGGTAWC